MVITQVNLLPCKAKLQLWGQSKYLAIDLSSLLEVFLSINSGFIAPYITLIGN